MSRLIDADELMNYCLNLKEKKIDCNDIARFPTAYNVDHAVEEMEELRAHYVDACCMCSGSNCGKCNITEFISELERLIEILENGGVKNEMQK